MHFRQFYLGCLAHASYIIGSKGEAAVVDPQRDVDLYLQEAAEQRLVIRHVIETHLHADFVSGHRELAERTGSRIYFGSEAGVKFPHVPVHDGDEIRFGDVVLQFLETPGHTPESISILVHDRAKSEVPEAVLTGDTLFIGDVGRPDLLGSKMSASELAGKLYDSLRNKLLVLPDHVRVFPAHGAGSLCGRNISSERSSTIGHERRFNYALQPMSREEFIALTTVDLPDAPPYFSMDVEVNRSGPRLLEAGKLPEALLCADAVRALDGGALALDTRSADQFGAGHVPGALNIGLAGQFASWCGTLIPAAMTLVLIAEDEERVHESRIRLARVGLENVAGFLAGGVRAWDEAKLPLKHTEQINVNELHARLRENNPPRVLDVRRLGEWKAGHIPGAFHIPLPCLARDISTLEKNDPLSVICAGGYRSSIGTSILERCGFTRISNVIGGMAAWNSARYDIAR